MKLLILQFAPVSHNFVSLRPKYLPWHSILRQPQSTCSP